VIRSLALFSVAVVSCVTSIANAQQFQMLGEPIPESPSGRELGRCREGGDQLSSGYWGDVGSHRRAISTRLEVTAGPMATGARLNAAYAHRIAGPLKGVIRLDTALARTYPNGEAVVEPPPLGYGFLLRSICDGYRLEFGARVLWPGWSPPDRPAAYGALDAALMVGPADDVLFLRRAELAAQAYVVGRLRTRGANAFPVSVEFGARLGTVQIDTWLGPQEGTVGGFWIDFALLFPKAYGLRVGFKAEAGLSTLMPANEVLPLRIVLPSVGFSPFYALTISAAFGFAVSLRSPTRRADLIPFGTLQVEVFYDDLFD